VQEAHAQGIIHRDIKPDNLYLCSNMGAGDYVKVLDFSVAKLDDPNSQQTRAGVVFGTPCYMSPEQGRGAPLGPGSDIYAFGICLYEMVNGKPPFDSKIPTEVVMMHIRDKPAPLQGVPEPLSRIVFKALDKDPMKRQRSCEQMEQECLQAIAELYPNRTPSGMHAQVAPRSSGQPAGAQAGGRAATGAQAAGGMPAGAGGASVGAAGVRAAAAGGAPAQRGVSEQKTMIAMDGVAPSAQGASGGAPQFGNAYSGGGGYAPPSAGPPPSSYGGGGGGMQAPMPSGGNPQGTMMLPDSAGVIAFAQAQAEAARQKAAVVEAEPVKPAGPLFWAAWVVLGVGIGLAIHFILVHQQLQAMAVAAGHG